MPSQILHSLSIPLGATEMLSIALPVFFLLYGNVLQFVTAILPPDGHQLIARQVLLNTWTQNSKPIPGIQSWDHYKALFKPSPLVDPSHLEHYKTVARLIQVGYCPKDKDWLETWTCGACLEPNSQIKNTTNLKRFMTDQSDAHGFYGVSHSNKRVFIVFEGMITSTQRKRIFQYRMKRLQKGVKAHRMTFCLSVLLSGVILIIVGGFIKSWVHVRPLIEDELLSLVRKYRDYTVGLYGHSYGGGIINVMAYMIATGQFGLGVLVPQQIEIITLGASRVGNQEFADILNGAHFKHMARLVHSNDLVPHLPFSHGRKCKFSSICLVFSSI